MADPPTLRASEIGRFTYCAHAWWLQRVEGLSPAPLAMLERGERAHRAHGFLFLACRWAKRLAYLLLATAVALSLAWLARGWMGR